MQSKRIDLPDNTLVDIIYKDRSALAFDESPAGWSSL